MIRKAIIFISLLLCGSLSLEAKGKNYTAMADSEIERNPEAWTLDGEKKPKWNYTQGLELHAMLQIWQKTGAQKYFDYAYQYADMMVEPDGTIETYKQLEYNIDRVNGGKFLFILLDATGEERFEKAIESFREQMRWHPRTKKGSYWHKKIYAHQVWLDGVYMAAPFLAQYAERYNEPELFDEVALQIVDVAKRMRDKETGLFYHAWDEWKEQRWADPESGLSPNFWSRSIGWYMMAIVDVLDYLPKEHKDRERIIKILQQLSKAVEKYQDPERGMWYQVTDQVGREGNYLESSGSAMFIYAWVKGAQKGYLDKEYLAKGKKAYRQFVKCFFKHNDNGTVSITNCCAVAGLGGQKKYRDGSFDYYISEPIIDNDPKTVGPFIMLSLLLNR